ncbi:MAG: histidine kinase [Candidatus Latescibacterota bacterium]
MNQVILSSDQFVLLTLLLKLGVMASFATILVNFSSFKRVLFADARTKGSDVRVALLLALFFAAGVVIRILMGYWAVDVSLPGSFLIGLLTGIGPGAMAGFLISSPAMFRGEFLSLPVLVACGIAGGAIRASLSDRTRVWSFSPLPFASLYRSVRAAIVERKLDVQLIILLACLGLDAVHYILNNNYPNLLFDVHPDHWGVAACRFIATLSLVGIPLKIWNNTRLEQQLEQRELRLLEARFHALKNQINPHFLFNTLNSISSCLWNDPKQARRILLKLSAILRRLLHSEKDFVPLSDELEFIDNYLEIETIRFGEEKLRIQKDIDARILDVPVPGMALQPFVENALKYGIAPLLEGGVLAISAKKVDGIVAVVIEDNGTGIGEAYTSKGIGIKNVIERLNLAYGPGEWCTITSPNGKGTRVEVRFPMKARAAMKDER